jgi:hypothetical protein
MVPIHPVVLEVKQTSSQEPLDGLEPYLAEMFLARSLSSAVTFCSDRPPFKMAVVTRNRNFFNCPLLATFNLVQRFQRRRFQCDLLSKYA